MFLVQASYLFVCLSFPFHLEPTSPQSQRPILPAPAQCSLSKSHWVGCKLSPKTCLGSGLCQTRASKRVPSLVQLVELDSAFFSCGAPDCCRSPPCGWARNESLRSTKPKAPYPKLRGRSQDFEVAHATLADAAFLLRCKTL